MSEAGDEPIHLDADGSDPDTHRSTDEPVEDVEAVEMDAVPPWRDPATVVPLVVAASAIAAAFSGQQPTGSALGDFVLPAAFGGAIAWLASAINARDTQWLGLAGLLALFFSGFQLPAVALAALGVAAVAVIVMGSLDDGDRTIVQAVAGALIVHAALNLPSVRFVGTASLFAAITVLPVVVFGLRALPDDQRAMANRAMRWIAGFFVVATALAVGTALWARGPVETGISQAEGGIAALEAGNQPRAVELLESSQANFDTARSRLGSPLVWPSRLVPIAAQHSRALETAANEGRNLAAAAVKTVTTADVDQIRGSNGAIDLDIVQAVNLELSNANLALRRASNSIRSVRSPWLLPLLDDRLSSVEVELSDVLADIDLANNATAVVPQILGAQGPRTYLVLFVQPAEAREYGGFAGAFGLLQANQGKLTLLESGSVDTDTWSGDAEFAEPGSYPAAYFDKQPFNFPQNITGIADLATVARAAQELTPQWRDDPGFTIDGVLTVDPYALAGFLELTGPVTIASREEPLDASNVADYLMRDQYLEFSDEDLDARRDGLRELAAVAFSELLSIEIPGPERLGAIFGPLARSDRLAFYSFDEAENQFLRRVLLDADLPIVSDEIEMVAWHQATGVAGKLDAYTTRDITYEVTFDPETGASEGLLTVDIRNEAPADASRYVLGNIDRAGVDGEETLVTGTNLIVASLITRADVGDVDSPSGAVFADGNVTGLLTYDHRPVGFEVPLGGAETLTVPMTNMLAPGDYRLLLAAQPLATIGDYTVIVRPSPGWRISPLGAESPGMIDADGAWTDTGAFTFHQAVTVAFERDD